MFSVDCLASPLKPSRIVAIHNRKILALEGALQEQCSLHDLRLISRGQSIPDSMRVQVWQRLLGSSSGVLNGLDRFNEIFDLANQSQLREDCSVFVEKLDNEEDDKVSILSDLESLVTHYCKTHQIKYEPNNGWLHMLRPLVSLKLSKNDLYSYFNAILESYIPRQCHFNGVAMHLFRLLLLYHEPELCSFLDSHKIAPNLYTQKWFLSLFAASSNLPAVLALWDYYFIRGDPFLIFFLSLVLVINAKDEIMAHKGQKEKILKTIAELPQQMEAGDIHDFCSLAVLYSAQTPFSYKRDYHQALFGENVSDERVDLLVLSQALCLPVSVQELLVSCRLLNPPTKSDAEARALRFFLVDCRPAEQYNAGHLPTAFHLDSNLMLTEPQAFNVAVQALLSSQKQSIAAQSAAGGEHLVFFGSGREAEDQYVHMVVAFFLQRHVQFVGLVQGGFHAVHQALVAAQMENGGVATSISAEPIGLVDHNPSLSRSCGKEQRSRKAVPEYCSWEETIIVDLDSRRCRQCQYGLRKKMSTCWALSRLMAPKVNTFSNQRFSSSYNEEIAYEFLDLRVYHSLVWLMSKMHVYQFLQTLWVKRKQTQHLLLPARYSSRQRSLPRNSAIWSEKHNIERKEKPDLPLSKVCVGMAYKLHNSIRATISSQHCPTSVGNSLSCRIEIHFNNLTSCCKTRELVHLLSQRPYPFAVNLFSAKLSRLLISFSHSASKHPYSLSCGIDVDPITTISFRQPDVILQKTGSQIFTRSRCHSNQRSQSFRFVGFTFDLLNGSESLF
nr:EOG090X03TX [Ceriodaphnia reticulata]